MKSRGLEATRAMWVLLLGLSCLGCEARSLEGAGPAEDSFSSVLVVVCVASTVCTVLLLLGCAEICKRHTGFKDLSEESQLITDKDFENEDSFTPTDVVPSGPAGDFSLYPPVESTPDPGAFGPIIFEPLPDIPGKRHRVSNASALRPKVSTASSGRERVDSEESLEDIIERDSMQDKLKLQNLLMGGTTGPVVASLVDVGCDWCNAENAGPRQDPELCFRTANSRNQLPRSQLQYIKELGSGYFGKVLQGEGQRILPGHKKTKVVIQMLNEEADPHDQLNFLQEALPYRETDHLNVMKILGQCVETMPYLVVLELCPFGDLKTYLRSHRIALDSFNDRGLLLKFASDMAAGLQALHQGNFIHHDFAIRNCLLASDLTVKIGDYGMSEEMFKEDYYFDSNGDAVPIRWLAPESLGFLNDGSPAVRPITKEANIWSFGVALWECVQFGTLPYSDLSNDHVIRLVIREKSIRLPKPDLPISHLDRLYQLIGLCQSDPAHRPSLRELRIMLLHLLSSKTDMDTNAFDTKWNQLMPRRAPQVTQVPGVVSQNGHIQTVSGAAPTPGGGNGRSAVSNGVVPQHAAAPSRPANLNLGGAGDGPDFLQLDASQLPEDKRDDEDDDLEIIGRRNMKKKVETPSNEMSLEAELSAAFSATQIEGPAHAPVTEEPDPAEDSDTVNLSLDEDIVASSTPKAEDAAKQFPALPEVTSSPDEDVTTSESEASKVENTQIEKKDEDLKSDGSKTGESDSENEKSDEANSPLHKSEPQEISKQKRQGDGSTIILEDESFAGESPVPDIVATSLVKGESETPPDFMTSTPKKPDHASQPEPIGVERLGDKNEDALTNSTINTDVSHYQSMSDNSASTQYTTALSTQQTNTSADSSHDDSAEFSFLGEKKFAALLQTVPSFSYDGDESEMMSSSFGSAADKSGEFGSGGLDKSSDDILGGGLSSGNVTPTPAEGVMTSADAVTPSGDEKRLLTSEGNESVATLQAGDSSHVLQETPLMPAGES